MAKLPIQQETAKKPVIPPKVLIEGNQLRVALSAIARAHQGSEMTLRNEALALLKATMSDGRAYVQKEFESGKINGEKCSIFLSHLMDELLGAICDFTLIHVLRLANPTEAEKVGVVAVGGYGRGQLAPYSDVDLLFLLPYKKNASSEQFVEYVLYMLWDMGLKVGHATRTVSECVSQALDDMTVRTSMLEARHLWGEDALYADFLKAFKTKVKKGTSRDFVSAKLEERDQRHNQSGRSRYLVEPNLKEGKGGLRDLNTLFWVAKYCYDIDDIDALIDLEVLQKDELALFKRCARFLWSVRCHLHFMSGRGEERLSFDVQTELTRRMGVKPTKGLNAVERFMRQYFLVAKDVGDLTAIFCAALEEEQTKKSRLVRLPALFRRQKNVHGFAISKGRLAPARPDVFEQDPVNLIRVFNLADKYGLDIHPDTMRELTRSLHLIDRKLCQSEEANTLFLEILTSRKDPERALRRMNEAGVLGRFISDFGRIVALMQFNMYHHYTADEHLLRAIGILSEIDRGLHQKDHALASRLMSGAVNRRVIYLAMLLHDIAKGRPEDHSVAGARIARKLGPRLGFSAEEVELTAWLVEEHLVMSDVAQRRDLSDPKTIEAFVSFVQSAERLKHLYVLTVVDIQAVGPGVWNSWKSQLLRDLYEEAEAILTGGGSMAKRSIRLDRARAALKDLLTGQSPKKVEAYLKRHQDAYWLNFDLAIQRRHYDLLTQSHDDEMVVDFYFDDLRGVTAVTFISPDHPGLFARLTGACAVAGLNILDARITTTRDGMAVDTLYVRDPETEGPLSKARQDRLRETMRGVLLGEISAPDNFAPVRVARRLNAFNVPARVMIDNDLSDQATVIEVSGLDRPGLLHALSRDLFNDNVSITAARVATWGERAVDVFYVTDLMGYKITSTAKLTKLTNRLKAVIADPAASARPAARRDKVLS